MASQWYGSIFVGVLLLYFCYNRYSVAACQQSSLWKTLIGVGKFILLIASVQIQLMNYLMNIIIIVTFEYLFI